MLKDEKEIKKYKSTVLKSIKQSSKDKIKNTNKPMPQFSEKYIEETKGEKESPKMMEGYLASLLNLSDNLPFKTLNADMVFTLDKNTYIKILKEVERIKVGEDVEPELLEIEPSFDVEVGEISFTFVMQIED